MKKTTFLITFFLLTCFLYHAKGQILTIKTGIGASKIKDFNNYNEGIDVNSDYQPSFKLGVNYEHPLFSMYSLESGLFMDIKSGVIMYENSDEYYGYGSENKFEAQMVYLSMPVHFKFFNVNNRFYGITGLSLCYALKAHVSYYAENSEDFLKVDNENPYEWFDIDKWQDWDENEPYNMLKRTDIDLDFGCGFQTKRWQFEFLLQKGIKNIASHEENTLKNAAVMINFGYKIDLTRNN